MDKRRKLIDKDVARDRRAQLFDLIDRGQISLRDAVKQMRQISGMTQTEFAAHRGVSAKVIKEIERGVGNPTVNTLNQIGVFFGLEVSFVRAANLKAGSELQEQPISKKGELPILGGNPGNARGAQFWPSTSLASGDYSSMINAAIKARRYSAVTEIRELVDAAEKMKELATPSRSVQEALRELGAAETLSKNNPGMHAISDALRIMETADKIQRQVQPPKEVRKWLENIENLRRMLEPLNSVEQDKKPR